MRTKEQKASKKKINKKIEEVNKTNRLFEFFRCSSERPEAAQRVLREQESLLPALQPRLHTEKEHDAAPASRMRYGAQVPVPVLQQALQVHAEHLRAHPKVSSRSGAVFQTVILNVP